MREAIVISTRAIGGLGDDEFYHFCQDNRDLTFERLGWLIDAKGQATHVYRPGREVQKIPSFDTTLSGGEVLPGFTLDLRELK